MNTQTDSCRSRNSATLLRDQPERRSTEIRASPVRRLRRHQVEQDLIPRVSHPHRVPGRPVRRAQQDELRVSSLAHERQ